MQLRVAYSKTGSQNGLPNVYLEDETGRKVAAVWGKAEERYDTAALLAAAPAMETALRALVAKFIETVNGDAAYWDPETADEVIAARAALPPERTAD